MLFIWEVFPGQIKEATVSLFIFFCAVWQNYDVFPARSKCLHTPHVTLLVTGSYPCPCLFFCFFCHKILQAPPTMSHHLIPPLFLAPLTADRVDLTLLVFVLQSAAMEETVIWEQHTVTLHRVSATALVRCLDQIVLLGGSRW